MLTAEQDKEFQALVDKAIKINGGMSIHIRVSGRQMGDKSWCIGLIFGSGQHSDWLKIKSVEEAELRKNKTIYRSMLKDYLNIRK